MRRSGSRPPGTARPGWRRAAALAVAAVSLAGCQAAAAGAGAGTGRSATSATGAGRGRSANSASARPAPSPSAGQPSGASARIMIVGDSITEGSAGDYTWQYWLYEHLRTDGLRPRMVGPNHWLYNNVTRTEGDRSYANPRFEHANDASWGMTVFGAKDAIGATVTTYRPDYLLVLLGLDDLFWYGISQPDMGANLAGFIAAARAARPHVRIVFGLLPPDIHTQTSSAFAASVASYNRTISSTASQLSTATSPIAVARDGGINVAADLWDGTHPNTNGQIKIAGAFADILASRFHLGSAYPRPFPVRPAGPLILPRLTATPSRTAGQAKLSWTPVPGADRYYVYLRDVTRSQAGFRRLPWPLSPGQDPWTVSLLTRGDTYEFQLQACKGADCGALSKAASTTAP